MQDLRWPLRLTRLGMLAERVIRSFWPFISVIFLILAGLMFGVHETLPLEAVWAGWVLGGLAILTGLAFGVRRFRWPTRAEALARLDVTLPGRPIAAIMDDQVIGAGDAASRAVWAAHVARMSARARRARAVAPDLRVADRDPYALRYVATLALVTAVLFGSIWRVASVVEMVPGGQGPAYAGGPTWEGWVQPPAYTGKPSIYLADISSRNLSVPQGSRVTLRLYGQIGALTVAETVSGRTGNVGSAAEPDQSFNVTRSGNLEIEGPGGRKWDIAATPDTPPVIALDGPLERGVTGEMRLPFAASDDYGVVSASVQMTLDLAAVKRRYGLAVDPEPRDPITLDLPMPFNGDRRNFREVLIENLAEHPWAGLPVKIVLSATDAAGQTTVSAPQTVTLPGRHFFDPLAAALVEQRRDLLWSRANAPRVAQILRAVSNRPDDIFTSDTAYLKLRVALRRLEIGYSFTELSRNRQTEIAQALWDIAIGIEDGNLADARERLRQAQDRLQQAIRDGASDEEIAKLMEDLRQAMQDYVQQLAQEQQNQQNSDQAQNQNTQQITNDQLQQMLDRIQELMQQGRMAEAQQALDELRRMMENLQVTQGQSGQQSPGQQALEGLADTLRRQQALNDDTFNDLQQQFDQSGQDGQQQGQQGQQGQQQGQGQQPGQGDQQGQNGQNGQPGQQGQRGQGAPDGRNQQPGSGGGQGAGSDPTQGLAERQQALRQLLNDQSKNLPGPGSGTDQGAGKGARDSLDRAGRAMDGAERSLRQQDYAGALDDQARALEALREGMRTLAEQLAQQQQSQQAGQQGDANGRATRETRRDPLGRDAGAAGRAGTDEQLLQGQDVYRRAKELLDEIRRRSSQQERPQVERNYLRRLLDRF